MFLCTVLPFLKWYALLSWDGIEERTRKKIQLIRIKQPKFHESYLQTPCTLFTPLQNGQNSFQIPVSEYTCLVHISVLSQKGSKVLEINNLKLHDLECNQKLPIYKDWTHTGKKWQPATNLDYNLLVKAETKHN